MHKEPKRTLLTFTRQYKIINNFPPSGFVLKIFGNLHIYFFISSSLHGKLEKSDKLEDNSMVKLHFILPADDLPSPVTEEVYALQVSEMPRSASSLDLLNVAYDDIFTKEFVEDLYTSLSPALWFNILVRHIKP